MLSHASFTPGRQRGDTLLEVLISLVLVAFGMLGFAGFMSKIELTGMETHQRAQASALLKDMTDRIRSASSGSNYANAEHYVLETPIGTGDSQPASCSTLSYPATADQMADHDLCEWSNILKGAAEKKGSTNVGGMIGARACITQVQAADLTSGICQPAIYQVTIAWQGLNSSKAPTNECGKDEYGDEKLRRVASERVVVGLPACN